MENQNHQLLTKGMQLLSFVLNAAGNLDQIKISFAVAVESKDAENEARKNIF